MKRLPSRPWLVCVALASVGACTARQLFDSWAGALSEADYRRYVQPHSATVLATDSLTPAYRASTSASAPANC